MFPLVVWETIGKHPLARWQQSLSSASDPLVFPKTFLENNFKIHVLLALLALAVAAVVAVASINDLKYQLRLLSLIG